MRSHKKASQDVCRLGKNPLENKPRLLQRRVGDKLGSTLARTFASIAWLTLSLSISLPPALGAPTAPATDSRGPLKTETAEYHLAPSIDADILANTETEIWARVFWPSPLLNATSPTKTKRPLLLFLHGNHGTCGKGTAPRNDNGCEYTREGTCPNGSIPTPNHEGYNYVAENLASWGYIVVSINANRGITCGGGQANDWGLNLARGRLILKHLENWSNWSTKGGAPSGFPDPNLFIDAVDLSQVGLMGHSRGGEGARAALNLFKDTANPWVAKIPGLDIKAIYEIGAVDGQTSRTLDAPSVAWNQLLPLCDGDVSDLEGRMPFERMMTKVFGNKESESRPSPKSLTMVWGANHNYFNTEWQTSDSWGCSGGPAHKPIFDKTSYFSKEQQSIALQSMTGFFRAHVGPNADPKLAKQFDTAFDLPQSMTSVGRIDRDFMPALDDSKFFRVEDFSSATGTNPSGAINTAAGVTIAHNAKSSPMVGNIQWNQPGVDQFYQSNFAEIGQGIDVTKYDLLDFRIGRDINQPGTVLAQAIDLSVALVGADDALSTPIAVAHFSVVQGPPNDNTALTQTVRIPISNFASSGFDLRNVRGVRFTFDKTANGKVRLAHVRFGLTTDKSYTPFSLPISSNGASNTAIKNGLPNSSSLMGPVLLAPLANLPTNLPIPALNSKETVGEARWLNARRLPSIDALEGQPGVEIAVKTLAAPGFPPMDDLAVLNIGNRLFPISRYPSNGKIHTLVFSISKSAFDALPATSPAQVQYGLKVPSRVWNLPVFAKGQLGY